MEVVEYKKETHLTYIKDWLAYRGMDLELANDIPRIGYIVYGNLEPIAAGFLRLVEADYLILDSLITNPNASGKTRNDAIDMVVDALITRAKLLGKLKIIANSIDANTLERSKKHGFRQTLHRMIVLDLREDS